MLPFPTGSCRGLLMFSFQRLSSPGHILLIRLRVTRGAVVITEVRYNNFILTWLSNIKTPLVVDSNERFFTFCGEMVTIVTSGHNFALKFIKIAGAF